MGAIGMFSLFGLAVLVSVVTCMWVGIDQGRRPRISRRERAARLQAEKWESALGARKAELAANKKRRQYELDLWQREFAALARPENEASHVGMEIGRNPHKSSECRVCFQLREHGTDSYNPVYRRYAGGRNDVRKLTERDVRTMLEHFANEATARVNPHGHDSAALRFVDGRYGREVRRREIVYSGYRMDQL